jgi:hypothetical protein
MSAFWRDGVAHRGDRDLVGRQPVGVEPDVDGAFRPPTTRTSPTPRARSSGLDPLVGDLRQLAMRPIAGQRERHHRRLSLSNLPTTGGSASRGRSPQHPPRRGRARPAPRSSMSRPSSNVTARARCRPPRSSAARVDALDGVDRFLDALRDLRLHLLGRRARQPERSRVDRGQIDGGEPDRHRACV